MRPILTKGQVYEHKNNCKCFRCSGICWNKGIKTGIVPKTAFKLKDPRLMGENHHLWKGDKATYEAKHIWMVTNFGRPKKCEICKTTRSKTYNWANISGEYKRDRNDWLRLCRKCHHAYDDISTKMWETRRLYV